VSQATIEDDAGRWASVRRAPVITSVAFGLLDGLGRDVARGILRER
jgi:hypothetical protein